MAYRQHGRRPVESLGRRSNTPRTKGRHLAAIGGLLLGALVLLQPATDAAAFSNPAPVALGEAGAFTVLAGSTVTSTGNTVISADAGVGGNLGVSPGSAVTGFPPGVVSDPGTIITGVAAAPAQASASDAYSDAEGRTADVDLGTAFDLGGHLYTAGVYGGSSSLAITGTVTLDGEGNPDAVFIFQAGSTLGTAASSSVLLINGAQASNVFWQVGSSTTLGADSSFSGTILALTSATLGDNVAVQGRVLAGSGAVTLINDSINTPAPAPSSGVPQAPLFGGWGWVVAVAAFLGAGLLVVRRRMRPADIN